MDIDILKDKKLLKSSKAIGTKFVTKIKYSFSIYIHNKSNNNVYEMFFIKTNDKYTITSNIDGYGENTFVPNTELQMIFFDPIVIVKNGSSAKTEENIYFVVDDNIDLYEDQEDNE